MRLPGVIGIGTTLTIVCCVALLPLAADETLRFGHGSPMTNQPGTVVLLLRGPYLQLGTSSSITVRWRTSEPTPSRVIYGSAPGSLNSTEEQAVPTTEHAVVLSGLQSDTRYYYAVGDDSVILAGDDADHFFVTAPLSGTPKPTRIWVLGDSGTGNPAAIAVRDAYYALAGTTSTDFWLMLGDNAYPQGTDDDYQAKLFEIYPEVLRQSVLWPTVGNHDAVSSTSSTQTGPYFDMFTLPIAGDAGGAASGTEAYYSFDYANMHFVVLDSQGSSRLIGSPMLNWLELDLASTAQDWIVAYWHHPPYSKGGHDSDAEIELIEMRENALPILEDHGVDLVLTGHSHSYERSFLIDGHYGSSNTLADDMLIDDGDGRAAGDGVYWKPTPGPDPHHGAVYTVAGCSALTTPGSFDHPAMYVSMQTLGSVVLDVDGDQLDLRFLDSTGGIGDSFTIIKGCEDSDRSISSLNPAGNDSFVFTPGQCAGGPPCPGGSSVSAELDGSFWVTGEGDPAEGAGTDNGGSQPLQPGNTGWVKNDPDGRAYIDGSWSTTGGVDGCIGLLTETECMTLMLADQADSLGYFAALTAEADPSGDYYFDQPGTIALAPIPGPFITGSQTLNPYTKTIDLFVSPPNAGVYLDGPVCDDPIVTGYRIYQQTTGRIDPPPTDLAIANGWTLADGGELPSGEPLPLGAPTTVTITCYTALNYYLGSSLVFEGGFELPVVSMTPFYILCSNCENDDDQDGSCSLYITGQIGPECDDDNNQVYPGAPQVCGDLLNNDCEHPSWPGLIGTNEFDDDGDTVTECQGDCADDDPQVWGVAGEVQSLLFAANKQTLDWTPPPVGGEFGSFAYDLLRSEQPFVFEDPAACLAWGIQGTQGQDSELPTAGSPFYYLVRPENTCGMGPLGQDSNGIERTGPACP